MCQKIFLKKITWLHTFITRSQFVTVVMLRPSICTGYLHCRGSWGMRPEKHAPRSWSDVSWAHTPGPMYYKNFKYFKWYKNRNKQLRGIMYRLQVTAQIMKKFLFQWPKNILHSNILSWWNKTETLDYTSFTSNRVKLRLRFTWHSPDVHLTTWPSSDLPLTLTRPLPYLD